jgi:hypothetical protein
MKIPNFGEFYRLEIENHILYHISSFNFDLPEEKFLLPETNCHNNGALGLWSSTQPISLQSFGSFSYRFNLSTDSTIIGWEIGDFFNFCSGRKNSSNGVETRKEYIEIRNYLIKKGIDAIYILDTSNWIKEVIVLNYDKIENFHLKSASKDYRIPIKIIGKFLD